MTAIIISFLLITFVNVSAFIWAYKKQSDHLTDISYSLCFIAVTMYFFFVGDWMDISRMIFAAMIICWGIRLGGFLFFRIHKMGKDSRFDNFRENRTGFLKFWLLQSVSIWIIALPVMIGLGGKNLNIHFFAVLLWMIGMIIETIADWQKFMFRNRKPAANSFIDYGLFTYIRHPNYLGEILIWVSIFWYISPALVGYEWLSVVSPLWVIALLLWISGIPLIEKTNLTKYKDNPEFKAYTERTWRLIPWIY
ncbi:MAG: DUF1295 domain-containing protein [Saprospiraceae bacterium]|nr:DUF1295 domain-containing protein [Saprospiraceae bacterium]